jgi:transposase InsO family protein
MDAFSRAIIGYRVSDSRAVGHCILAMRMAFNKLKKLPKAFKFIADGYSAYPLAAQQFELRKDDPLRFNITPVIGLTNDDAVSKEFRHFKQLVERLNRTFKFSYRPTCGFDNFDGANYSVSLWVAYYNFLRPHMSNGGRVLNRVPELIAADNMPAKWQVLLKLGQDKIMELQVAS